MYQARITILSVITSLSLLLLGTSITFAAPLFTPGETLDPDCTPGQTGYTSTINGNTGDCNVQVKEIEQGTGAPTSTPTGTDPLTYLNETNGDLYTWDGAAWNITGEVTPTNGLQDIAGSIGLGGTLMQNTTIDADTFTLDFLVNDGTHTHTLTNGENNFSIDLPDLATLFGAPVGGFTADIEIAGVTKQIGNQKTATGVFDLGDLLIAGSDNVASGILWLDEETDEFMDLLIDETGLNFLNVDPTKLGLADFSIDDQNGIDMSIQDFTTGDGAGFSLVPGFATTSIQSGGTVYDIELQSSGLAINPAGGGGAGYTLPWHDGTANQVLQTDGSGNVSWVTGGDIELYDENPVSLSAAGNATGDDAISFQNGTSTGPTSFSAGAGTIASGSNAVAFGSVSIAQGDASFAGGSAAFASGNDSFAYGNNVSASGAGSFAMGVNNNTASGIYSFSFGDGNTASGSYSTVSGGAGNIAHSYGEWVGGTRTTNYTPSSATGWNPSDRLFNIGNGTNPVSLSDAFTILKNGQVGIGADNFEAITNGNMFQIWDGAGSLIAYVDDATGNWTPVSDERAKKNISSLSYGLDTINQLNPVHYQLIRNDKDNIGFLAQEVKEIIPEIVSGDDKVGYGISYAAFTPILTKAIQELDQKIKDSEIVYTLTQDDMDKLEDAIENRVRTEMKEQNELCVDGFCITKEQFMVLFENTKTTNTENQKSTTETLVDNQDESTQDDNNSFEESEDTHEKVIDDTTDDKASGNEKEQESQTEEITSQLGDEGEGVDDATADEEETSDNNQNTSPAKDEETQPLAIAGE